MTSAVEVKLLTLLNVSAVKRPRDLDLPGGHRGSPSLAPTTSPVRTLDRRKDEKPKHDHSGGTPKKRRNRVVFGGEVGPSGSTFGNKGGLKKDRGLTEGSEVEVQANGEANGRGSMLNGLDELHGFEEDDGSENEAGPSSGGRDTFNEHFGSSSSLLEGPSRASAEANEWRSAPQSLKGFGKAVRMLPGKRAVGEEEPARRTRVIPALVASLKASTSVSPLFSTCLSHVGTYQDFYLHSLEGEADGSEKQVYGEEREAMRKAAVVHAMNHVLKTRRRIVRNNEKLAHAAASPDAATSMPEPPRDQSFTRPKVLLLLPLRSLALHYIQTHLFPLAPKGIQIENARPFISSFGLPAEAGEDPLAAPSASSSFSIDHIANFRGNSDDNFRFGIKVTRKAWRVIMPPANEEKLMECDILIASPLGMKMAAEKEGSTDLLSSIEICLVDGMDVMQMQNWEHVQFIFSNLNKIPDSPHGCDFSRVKPWYLESQARFLRQTILLSRYDTPETRALFHRHCHNLEGKIRLERSDFPGTLGRVRSGVRQVFERIDVEGSKGMGGDAAGDEVEARLEWFIGKTIPALLRSAISRQNTIIVIPSYFDFVRVVNYLRKADEISYAAISEYSSNAEISRARTTFFKGKKAFLLVTERFHFYRRYRIRGAKTVVFYSVPEHAQFYSEFLQTPFLPSAKQREEVAVDEGEISSRVLFSRFDALRLERVVGSANCRRMLSSGEGRYEFI